MSTEDPPRRGGDVAEVGQEERRERGVCVTGLGLMRRWVQDLQGAKGLILEAVPWSWALGSWEMVVRKQGNE